MPHHPKPCFREYRALWYVQIDGRQFNLDPDKDEVFRRYHELMRQPPDHKVAAHSLARIIDAYLDSCQQRQRAATYEWYRYRLQRFFEWQRQHYPHLTTRTLGEFDIDEWLGSMTPS